MIDIVSNQTDYIVVPPAAPNDEALVKKISGMLADLEEIKEAHLPCIIEFGKSTESRPALFVIVNDSCDRLALYELLNRKLNRGFFKRNCIDIKIVQENFPLLQSVRDTHSLIGWRD